MAHDREIYIQLITILFLLILSVPGTTYATDLSIKGEIRNEENLNSISSSNLNPDNILDMPDTRSVTILFLEPRITFGEESFLKGLLSSEYIWKRLDYTVEEKEAEVKELYLSTAYNNISIEIGREKVRWGVGYSVSPTDIITTLRSPDDPEDRLNMVTGTDLIKLDLLSGDSSLSIVYLPDLDPEELIIRSHAIAMRYYTYIYGLDLSTVLLLGNPPDQKAGFNSSYVIGDALEIHGEFLWKRRKEGLFPDYINGPYSAYSDKPYSNGGGPGYDLLLGGQYTFDLRDRGALNLVAEYYRNGDGLTRGEMADLIDHVKYSHDLPDNSGHYLLKWAATAYRFPLGRDYIFLRVDYLFYDNRLEAELNTLVSIVDNSIYYQPTLTWKTADNISLYMKGTLISGDNRSEAGLSPVKSSLSVGGALSF
jgi:hypothetical protein